MKRFALLCIVLLVLVVSGMAGAAQYRTIDLGSINSYSFQFQINDSGQVVGPVGGLNQAYVWDTSGGVMNLGTLFSKDQDCDTYAINNSGQVAVYAHGQIYRWSSSTGPVSVSASGFLKDIPFGINNMGDIAGFTNLSIINYDVHACVWKANGQIVDLGIGMATDINDSGQVVGTSGLNYTATVWNPDGSTTSIGNNFNPNAINNLTQVVGYRLEPAQKFQALLWAPGVGTSLLASLAAGGSTYAYDINNAGKTVGWADTASNTRRAVLWDSNGAITDLGTLPGYTDSKAYGINDNGWIVGVSSKLVGVSMSYQLTVWQPVPEPTSILALLCGLGFISGYVRISKNKE